MYVLRDMDVKQLNALALRVYGRRGLRASSTGAFTAFGPR